MASIEESARRGQEKYLRRVAQANGAGARTQMGGNYREAFERAVAAYAERGFGPERTANYRNAYLTYGAQNYQPEPSWGATWAAEWAKAMRV
jgi:hypothetical protein